MKVEERLPDFIRSSYTIKLALASLVIIAAVVGVGLYTQSHVGDQVADEQLKTIQTNAEVEANAFGEWIDGEKQSVRLLSNHQDFSADDDAVIQQALDDELEGMPDEAAAIYFVERSPNKQSDGTDETIVASTDSELDGESLEETNIEWDPDVGFNFDNEDTVLSSWVYDDNGEPSIAIASPTIDGDHVVVVDYRTNVRAEAFSTPIEGTVTTVRGGSTADILFDKNKENVLSLENPGETELGEIILEADADEELSGSMLTDDQVIGYHRVPGDSDWVVVKEAPRENAMAVQAGVQQDILLLLAITLGGFVIIGAMIHRGPMRSIERLSDQANSISKGDLSVEIEDEGRIDEVGRLKDSFRETKSYLNTITLQAEALSNQEFDDDVLEEEIPGRVGDSMEEMQADLDRFITEIDQSSKEAQEAKERAEQAKQEAERLADDLESQAAKIDTIVQQVADGDLTKRLSASTDNDAMNSIVSELNHLLEELEAAFRDIQTFADNVEASGKQITNSIGEFETASQDVSTAAQEISDRTHEQNETIQEVSQEMENLSATIEEIAASSNEMATQSEEAVSAGTDSARLAQEAIGEMEAIDDQTDSAIEEVSSLEAELDEIDEVVTLITSIAEETNILALNAEIEAARAGEAGEGFAVVAQEIKQLAEDTEQATQEIKDLIVGVQEKSASTVDDMEAMGTRVSSGTNTVEQTVESLEEIVEQVEAVNDSIQSINDATDEQAASTEEVVSMLTNVGDMSQETASSTEELSAAAEEQTAQVVEVTTQAEDLSEKSQELQALLEQFDVQQAKRNSELRGSDQPSTQSASGDD